LFVGDGSSVFIPEVRALDIGELVPVNSIREPNKQPILYEKDILRNLISILGNDVDDTSSLLLR